MTKSAVLSLLRTRATSIVDTQHADVATATLLVAVAPHALTAASVARVSEHRM